MRMVHISDWHVGRHTYHEGRQADLEAVANEIFDLAKEFQPDLIVHTGDLFDAGRPGVADMTFATDTLRRLAGLAPVAVLAGNHDSPALFDLFDSMLGGDASPLRFIGRAARPADGGIHDYPTRSGERIRLAPLPFVHANRMIDALEDPGRFLGAYQDRIHTVERMLADGLTDGYRPDADVCIFAAHLHVGGASVTNSERGAFIKPAYETPVDHLPAVSYAAFGHIHRPQALPGAANVPGRYAGSPIQLDFGEVGETKSVVLIDAVPGRPAHVTPTALGAGRPLRHFDGTLDQLRAVAPEVGKELVLATIHTERPAAGLSETVRDLLPRAVVLDVNEVCAARAGVALSASVTGTGTEQPGFAELFGEYLAETGVGGSTTDAVMNTFADLIDAVDAGEEARFAPLEDLLETTASITEGEK